MMEKSRDTSQYIQELKESSQTILHRLHDVLEGNENTCTCECQTVLEQTEIKTLEAKVNELDDREKRRQVEFATIKHDMEKMEAALNDLCKSEKSNAVQLEPSETGSNQGDILGNELDVAKPTADDTFIVRKTNESGYSGSDYIKPTAAPREQSDDHSHALKEDSPVSTAKSHEVQTDAQDDDTLTVLDAKDSTASQHNHAFRKVENPNFKRKPEDRKKERKYRKPRVNHEGKRQYKSVRQWWELGGLAAIEGLTTEVQSLDGVHTILCVDISESMVDAWSQVQTFVHEYLDGLEKLVSEENFSEENVALVTFGHETKLHVRSTKELSKIRNAFESITLGGPTPMFGGILMAVSAAESNSKTCYVNGAEIHKRIVLISDGHSTEAELSSGPDVTDMSKLDATVALIVDILEKFPQSGKELICVPVGNANTDLIDTMQTCACGRRLSYTEGTKLARRFYLTNKSQIRLAGIGGIGGLSGMLSLGGLSASGIDLSEMGGMEGLSGIQAQLQAHLQAQVSQLQELQGSTGISSESTSTDITGLSKEDQDHIKEIVEDHKELTLESLKRKITVRSDMQYVESNSKTLPKIGSRVRRGPDWKWRNQDGEGPGTVIGHREQDGKVWVHWDADDNTNVYDYGGSMQYDVLLVDEPRLFGGNDILNVGCVVKPGDNWRFDFRCVQRNEEGVVIRLLKSKVQVKWIHGYRGDYTYSPNGPSELKIAKCSLSNPSQVTGSTKNKRLNKNKNILP